MGGYLMIEWVVVIGMGVVMFFGNSVDEFLMGLFVG